MNSLQYIIMAVKAAGPTVIPPLVAELEKIDVTGVNPLEKFALESAISWLKSQLPAEPTPSA